jgi:hypothetical protein
LDLFPVGTKLTNLNTKLQIKNTKAQTNDFFVLSRDRRELSYASKLEVNPKP